MTQSGAAQMETADREIVITRAFEAPPELVWRAWTDPEQVVRWWGPRGFTTTTRAMEVRNGGEWRFIMHGPDGRDYANLITFEEVVEPRKLVYAHRGEGADEGVKFRTTVLFERTGEGTKLTMRMVFPTAEDRERVVREYGAVEGGIQTVGRLADHLREKTGAGRLAMTIALPSEREILIGREFDAPRGRVWDAMTKPELLKKWLFGPPGWEMTECTEETRAGGAFRWAWRGPSGEEMAMRGVYREVRAPERIVRTETFEFGCEAQAGEQVGTLELTEEGGRTSLRLTLLYPSREARDGAVASGMEHGMAAGYERLEGMLAGSV